MCDPFSKTIDTVNFARRCRYVGLLSLAVLEQHRTVVRCSTYSLLYKQRLGLASSRAEGRRGTRAKHKIRPGCRE